MLTKHKILSWLFAIALLATSASAAYLIFVGGNQLVLNVASTVTSTKSVAAANSTSTTAFAPPTLNTKPIPPTTSPAATTLDANQTNTINITVSIGEKTFAVALPIVATAYDAILEVTKKYGVKFQFKEFADLGSFVESIDDISNNQTTGEYWIYYINGQSATVGISQYQLRNNDSLNWKYEKAKF